MEMHEPPIPKEKTIKMFGWHAHAGTKCKRCGWEHGPFGIGNGIDQEMWGCGQCGIGVLCSKRDQPDCDQAADIYMSIFGR